MNRPVRSSLVLSLLILFTALAAHAWDKKGSRAAAARATEAFSTTSFVAKIPLGSAVNYYVLPDGAPATKSGKRQGRGGEAESGAVALFSRGAVGEQQIGEGITVAAMKEEIRVFLHRKRGKVLNAPVVHILFGRETRPEDFDPHAIAMAVSSVAEIRGFEPGKAVEETLNEAVAAAEAAETEGGGAPAAPLPTGPTIVSLTVDAEPAVVLAGGEVGLTLFYELAGADSPIQVTESRTLQRGDEVMPTFPAVDTVSQSAGPVTSTFRQPLPSSVAPGEYTFVGEVCVADDCIRRSARFEVRRP